MHWTVLGRPAPALPSSVRSTRPSLAATEVAFVLQCYDTVIRPVKSSPK